MALPQILIVEDEEPIAGPLMFALETEGFRPFRVSTLEAARTILGEKTFGAIILDVGLPDGSGFEFCKEIRKGCATPVLFLTARSSEVDRIVGLEIGAEDYVVKPFSPREVTLRIRRLLKTKDEKPTKVVPGFSIDDAKKEIRLKNQRLQLTRYEYRLLKVFLENAGRVFSREQLLEKVWENPEESMDRTVDAHVKSLRQKLRELSSDKEWILTHRGMGYSFTDPS